MAYLLFESDEYHFRVSETNDTGEVEFLIHNDEVDATSVWANICLAENDLLQLKAWIDLQISKIKHGE